MKTKVALSFMALVFVGITNLKAQITVYKSANFGGESLNVSGNWSAVGTPWNDRTMSIKIPAGYKVTIYEHVNGGKPAGNSKVLYSDWKGDATFGGRISYISVEPNMIGLYKSTNFTGEKLDIAGNWSAASNMAWNDKINSIKVPAGYKIVIYENGPNNGKSLELTSDWVADSNWKNKISNINILSKPQ
ncbi:beta/gamma crystallin domain-containing protein [Emticicia sp. BO119]|uniref:beta/gamma crystallin domain-containing protein n=1 Tax=Emticicia sp. BO119 TaxID=2757768 RepID=UPI0015F0A323|nr:beta/gamma crystallin domain-containing protein [Emticicia sp. BO119]MBA4851900.1 hypothetical protein [Emticicia sp. BO119]